tara:strand:- start:688 stop:993 length:306 start_codon:yes stop_codon:yes gene_type:complete
MEEYVERYSFFVVKYGNKRLSCYVSKDCLNIEGFAGVVREIVGDNKEGVEDKRVSLEDGIVRVKPLGMGKDYLNSLSIMDRLREKGFLRPDVFLKELSDRV